MMILSPSEWATRQFGSVQLEDERRTPRAVRMGAAFMRHPGASLPQQMGSRKALQAAYRLLAEEDVTFSALMEPHWRQTVEAARHHPVVLFVQDTTLLDYSHPPTTIGLGPIGDGKGRGLMLQTVLAVVPQPRQVLGLAHQAPFLRQPVPRQGENASQRQKRPRESQVWSRSVEARGAAPAKACWVQVADRGSDLFEFTATCRHSQGHFLIRAQHNRRVQLATGKRRLLFNWARRLRAQGTRVLEWPARHGQPAQRRCTSVSVTPPSGPRLTSLLRRRSRRG